MAAPARRTCFSLPAQKVAFSRHPAYATPVGAKRVIWHVAFERNLRRRGPPSFEVRSEVPLSEEPPRLDYLLLRKLTPEDEPVDNSAQTLRHLWPLFASRFGGRIQEPGRRSA